MELNKENIQISNPFSGVYDVETNVILYAHNLIGTVRGKSANGLMIHNPLFNVVAIVDKNAAGENTAKICQGVNVSIPVYSDMLSAILLCEAKAVIFLIPPDQSHSKDIIDAITFKLDLINTSFTFFRNISMFMDLIKENEVRYFDLRDLMHLKSYPSTVIPRGNTKVVFVTGTDCGLGKRTAAYELTCEARKQGINATMYATGQTGLMLGEKGTVVDALTLEFSNGIISQQLYQLHKEGYEYIFVEGQSDILHPANSAVSVALLHGANPDCLIIVHDENRKYHKGFDEESDLYKMHSIERYIAAFEVLSLACGPVYKTVGIATIGNQNIKSIQQKLPDIPVADVRLQGGSSVLLESVLNFCGHNKTRNKSYSVQLSE